MEIERRVFKMTELRAPPEEGDGRTIAGHAAVFDELSEDLGGFREKIEPGAFTDTLKNDDVRALFNHNADYILGRTSAGTLRLREDKRGLIFENDVPETSYGSDLLVSIRRGDVSEMSFAFVALVDEWEKGSEKELDTRTLKVVRLFDASPVTFAAYPQTDVATRSLQAWRSGMESEADEERADRLRRMRLLEAEIAVRL